MKNSRRKREMDAAVVIDSIKHAECPRVAGLLDVVVRERDGRNERVCWHCGHVVIAPRNHLRKPLVMR